MMLDSGHLFPMEKPWPHGRCGRRLRCATWGLMPKWPVRTARGLNLLFARATAMTYCVMPSNSKAGLVFLSDSRTNAGLDQISTFRKMIVYEAGERFMVLLSAGNLSISQSVREILQVEKLRLGPSDDEGITIWNAKSMFDAARVAGGAAIRRVYERDAARSSSRGGLQCVAGVWRANSG